MRSPCRRRRRGRSLGSTTRMIFQRNVESQRESIARSSRFLHYCIVEWFLQCRGECSLQRKFPFPAVHSNHVRPSTPSPLIAPPSSSPCLPPSASQTQRVHCLPRRPLGGRVHFHHKLTPSRNVTAPLGVHYLHSRGQTGACMRKVQLTVEISLRFT